MPTDISLPKTTPFACTDRLGAATHIGRNGAEDRVLTWRRGRRPYDINERKCGRSCGQLPYHRVHKSLCEPEVVLFAIAGRLREMRLRQIEHGLP